MLLYFLITCFSFIFLKSLPHKPLPSWATEVRLLSLWFWKELFLFPYFESLKVTLFRASKIPSKISIKRMTLSSHGKLENPVDETGEMSILDLPELALDCILERLSPAGLCSMAGVCTSLRERCISDHLWERHMKKKWGRIIGPSAYREWQFHIASSKDFGSCKLSKQKSLRKLLSIVWPSSWMKSKDDKLNNDNSFKHSSSLSVDSIMSWYLAIESGRFWFPAQVYNRENGHVGFMLSCYDAELSYDPQTDTFQARYPPHGRRAIAIETGVQWDRIRAPPVDTSPHDLHISDCLNDLRPGDHIEIQWRRNKEFPYDTVVLEFHQYTRGSRWRCTMINRKEHREEGNEADGFYGGIRKLKSKEEISRWKQLWPREILE
ncbi:F-box protein At2g32560 isoform X2 [Manihot esculenta]|uniref:F-box protein At2g32560 isoform X2 n=1 Tax=Manihot esculenta TaxID=3983 RepID=UPI001CC78609|nr:F-box protein At2g32560 isoform X2 [Manihot esculenta]